jgi:uncharacterized membrane protein
LLITQNRIAALADDRADLSLEICLLTEHEITWLLALAAGIAKTMEIAESNAPGFAALTEDIDPEEVLEMLHQN